MDTKVKGSPMKPLLLTVFAVLAILPALAGGAIETEWGLESEFWETGSVVYGKVLSVDKKDDDNGHAVLRLSILATLAGPLDAAKVAELSVDVRYGLGIETGISVRELPGKGISRRRICRKVEGRNLPHPDFRLTFMPNHAAMFKVDGFDSAEVSKLIKVLRDVRKEYESARPREKDQLWVRNRDASSLFAVSILYPARFNPSVDSVEPGGASMPSNGIPSVSRLFTASPFASISHQPSPPLVPRETGVV